MQQHVQRNGQVYCLCSGQRRRHGPGERYPHDCQRNRSMRHLRILDDLMTMHAPDHDERCIQGKRIPAHKCIQFLPVIELR